MRVAVQLFGHLRSYEKCAPSLRRFVLDRYECDVFIHTWSQVDHKDLTWHNNPKSEPRSVSTEVQLKLSHLYDPVSLSVDFQSSVLEQEVALEPESDKRISAQGVFGAIRSMASVTSLRLEHEKKTGITYDLVLMTRPDVEFLEDPLLDLLFTELEEVRGRTIHWVHDLEYKRRGRELRVAPLMMDVAFVGHPSAMDALAGAPEWYLKHPFQLPMKNTWRRMMPEELFLEFLESRFIFPRFRLLAYSIRRVSGRGDLTLSLDSVDKPSFTRHGMLGWLHLLLKIANKISPNSFKKLRSAVHALDRAMVQTEETREKHLGA
jgi:hypothetical protein